MCRTDPILGVGCYFCFQKISWHLNLHFFLSLSIQYCVTLLVLMVSKNIWSPNRSLTTSFKIFFGNYSRNSSNGPVSGQQSFFVSGRSRASSWCTDRLPNRILSWFLLSASNWMSVKADHDGFLRHYFQFVIHQTFVLRLYITWASDTSLTL